MADALRKVRSVCPGAPGLPALPAMDRPVAYVCRGKSCLAPTFTPDELAQRISELAAGE